MAKLLVVRGHSDLSEILEFLNPSLASIDRFGEMKGQSIAVERVAQALKAKEKILLYGDYDVDGTCSLAMMRLSLEALGGVVSTYVPDRFAEGYGVSERGIDHALALKASVMITLDCGITAIATLNRASAAGVDVIICDHHIPGSELPGALAILNPQQVDCPFSGKELCGGGVALMLLRGISMAMGKPKLWEDYLDFAAVATCCDIVPLVGINRILVSAGIERLAAAPHLGFRTLLRNAGHSGRLSVSDVVFKIGPRINAAGRLAHARLAVDLLIADDVMEADDLAAEIEGLNTHRKQLDKQTTIEAIGQVQTKDPAGAHAVTVLSDAAWKKGVVGIVASRVMEYQYRPTIILAEADGSCTGSARSVKGINIYEMLKACQGHLEKFGGHAAAAGLTVKAENLKLFIDSFERQVRQYMPEGGFKPDVSIDLEVNFADWYDADRWLLMDQMEKLEPCGPANMHPLFISRGCQGTGTNIRGQEHLSFTVYQPEAPKSNPSVIAFRMADCFERVAAGHKFDLVYSIGLNHWQGESQIQLEAKAIVFE